MIPNKPIRIDKSFAFSSIKEVTTEGIPFIKIKGYASRMFDDSGEFVIDADRENINTLGIGLSRLKSGNLPLLYGHDQSKPVGKITGAEYVKDGLIIDATIYKLPGDELTNFVYESVKVGTLNSFSVGILVEEFDMIEKDGNDYLQLAKSEMIETSLVAVPSNSEATFNVLEVKGLGIDEKSTYKTIISKNVLKESNPNVCGEFETCILESVKALNYEDTKNEPWMSSRQFDVYLSALTDTLRDNFDANRWEELSALEVTRNIKKAFDAFIADQESLLKGNENPEAEMNDLNEALAQDGSFAFANDAKNINGDKMHTKDIEPEVEPKVEPEVEPKVEPEVEPKVEPEVEPKVEPEVEPVVEPKVEPEVEPKVEPEVEPVDRSADDFVVETALLGANIDKMDLEDMAKYFDSMSTLSGIIEEFVTSQVREEAEAQRADTSEA